MGVKERFQCPNCGQSWTTYYPKKEGEDNSPAFGWTQDQKEKEAREHLENMPCKKQKGSYW